MRVDNFFRVTDMLLVFFAITAHFAAIPIFLLAFNGLRVARLGQPASAKSAPPLPRWLVLLGFSIIPLTTLTFGFGVGLTSGARHFVTTHQVRSCFRHNVTSVLTNQPPRFSAALYFCRF